jgi:hemin uptake protein HemP
MSDQRSEPPRSSPLPEKPQGTALVVSSQQLFGSGREIVIEHAGVRYRLRITRRNKLILQK